MKWALFATAGFAAATVLIFSGLTTERLRAQTQTSAANRPAFDAVSVKPSDGTDPHGGINFQPGSRLVVTNVPLRPVIMMAYSLPLIGFKGGLIIGAPSWIDSTLYNIEARGEGDPPREQMLPMLQSLLQDRFKLSARWETRRLPIYLSTRSQ